MPASSLQEEEEDNRRRLPGAANVDGTADIWLSAVRHGIRREFDMPQAIVLAREGRDPGGSSVTPVG